MKLHWCLSATLLVLPAGAAAQGSDVAIKVGKGTVDFLVGKDLVTRYHTGPEVAKPYFYPVYAAGAVPVTRAWPMESGHPDETKDHVHQKSIWFCHGDVIPEGVELKSRIRGVEGVDFWSEAKGHGRIVCTRVGEPKASGGHGRVTTVNEWRTAEGQKILDETRTVHLVARGTARLLVLDIDLHAGTCPITFGDTKEGSMGIRINDSITEKVGKGKMTNARGKVGEKDIWGYHALWCDYSGPVGGKMVGLALLDDPANPHPAGWHSRGYGLMAANPFGRKKSGFPALKDKTDLVKMAKGDHLKFRYGILIHAGDAHEGQVEQHFQQFVKLRDAK